MSTTLGCGTHFYGHIDAREDRSYVTTKWVTFLYMPLFPLGSYRLIQQDSSISTSGYVISTSTLYQVLGPVSLSVFQVLSVYLSLAACCAWAAMFIALAGDVLDDSVMLQVWLVATIFGAPVLSFLYARRAGRNPFWWAVGGFFLSIAVPILQTTVVPARPRRK